MAEKILLIEKVILKKEKAFDGIYFREIAVYVKYGYGGEASVRKLNEKILAIQVGSNDFSR